MCLGSEYYGEDLMPPGTEIYRAAFVKGIVIGSDGIVGLCV